MSDESPRPPVPHPTPQAVGPADRVRRVLLGVPYLETVAWTAGELLHRRPSPPCWERRIPAPLERFRDETLPAYPCGAAGPPSRVVSAPGVRNPVLTVADVEDFGDCDCVADPFLFPGEDRWHMFFEVYNNRREPTAAIAHAESPDGYDWTYDRVVIETDEHLSFPYVFRWDGAVWMVPDRWAKTRGVAGTTLYRAEEFPHEWTAVRDILQPERPTHDFAPFRWNDRWWALAGDGRDLSAFYSDTLVSEWTPHPANPVVEDRRKAARPGGRPLVFEDSVVAFLQDTSRRYGERVRAFEVTELTPDRYADAELPSSPLVEPVGGLGWNSGAMHQFDPWYDGEGFLCAVDGTLGAGYQLFGDHHWAIGIYRA